MLILPLVVYEVICPKCAGIVRVHAEPHEELLRSLPPICPACKTSLYDQVGAEMVNRGLL